MVALSSASTRSPWSSELAMQEILAPMSCVFDEGGCPQRLSVFGVPKRPVLVLPVFVFVCFCRIATFYNMCAVVLVVPSR